jgi:uncharacterized membrane protein
VNWKTWLNDTESRAIDPLGSQGRLLVSLVVFLLCLLLLPIASPLERALAAYDAAALTLTVLAWAVLLRTNQEFSQRRAEREDPGRYGIFLTVLISSLTGLIGAIYALRSGQTTANSTLETLAVVAVVLGWIVTHTGYTFRYARIYYAPDENGEPTAGLKFPGDDQPDDMDFAYFAFTLGVAFQVSDVSVTRCNRFCTTRSLSRSRSIFCLGRWAVSDGLSMRRSAFNFMFNALLNPLCQAKQQSFFNEG